MIKKPMERKPIENICPLCSEKNPSLYYQDKKREYLRCSNCALVFVPSIFHLSREDEKARYDLHQNNSEDQGYRKFLSRLSLPLLDRLPPDQLGLDFGCGPGPVLSMMLEEGGHTTEIYDPFFADKPELLNRRYNFITASEVAEHIAAPGKVFGRLFGMLERGGYLGLMTKLVSDPQAFRSWHYIQDETHICFYSRETFIYLAGTHNADLEFIGSDVILMRKQ